MYKISSNTDRAFFYNIFLKLILKLLSIFLCQIHDTNWIPFKNRVVFFVTFSLKRTKAYLNKIPKQLITLTQSGMKSRPYSPPFLKWLLMVERKLIWKIPTFNIHRSVLAFKEKRMHLTLINKVPGTLLTMQTSVVFLPWRKIMYNNANHLFNSILNTMPII